MSRNIRNVAVSTPALNNWNVDWDRCQALHRDGDIDHLVNVLHLWDRSPWHNWTVIRSVSELNLGTFNEIVQLVDDELERLGRGIKLDIRKAPTMRSAIMSQKLKTDKDRQILHLIEGEECAETPTEQIQ